MMGLEACVEENRDRMVGGESEYPLSQFKREGQRAGRRPKFQSWGKGAKK